MPRPLLLVVLVGCPDVGKPGSDTGDTDIEVATADLYVHSGEILYTWDLETQSATHVGAFHDASTGTALSGVLDIAIDPSGQLYAAIEDQLYRVDAVDAGCTPDQVLPEDGTGLTFLADGRLVVGGEALVAIDLTTGTSEELVPAGTYTTSGDIVGVPQGTLGWTVRGETSDDWVSVDPDSLVATRLGPIGASQLWGVAYADYQLYAFGSDGSVWIVDPVTGAGTLVTISTMSFYGATTNPLTW